MRGKLPGPQGIGRDTGVCGVRDEIDILGTEYRQAVGSPLLNLGHA